ncbi:ankyrin repeat domain-containing protein 65 [Cyclospora cayetanensis]|uniref:Ankyrin repeat domain-containing protein 65 n=1 Tax=Cyclospora cayetanensis TaxID=88456 RepID=A0A6P6RQE1_9EIME|nr:ankyrin repeat domain-containing protein 65 [Cyclospora cayetanensis]
MLCLCKAFVHAVQPPAPFPTPPNKPSPTLPLSSPSLIVRLKASLAHEMPPLKCSRSSEFHALCRHAAQHETRARVSAVDAAAVAAFHKSVRSGDLDAVEKVLTIPQNSWLAVAVDAHRRTALHLAAFDGNDRMVRLLLRGGAQLKAPACDGMTALHFASQKGHKDVLETLLQKGAPVNGQLSRGKRTALHLAVKAKHFSAAVSLLEYGANLEAKTAQGETVLDWVSPEIAELLQAAAAAALNRQSKKSTAPAAAAEEATASPAPGDTEASRAQLRLAARKDVCSGAEATNTLGNTPANGLSSCTSPGCVIAIHRLAMTKTLYHRYFVAAQQHAAPLVGLIEGFGQGSGCIYTLVAHRTRSLSRQRRVSDFGILGAEFKEAGDTNLSNSWQREREAGSRAMAIISVAHDWKLRKLGCSRYKLSKVPLQWWTHSLVLEPSATPAPSTAGGIFSARLVHCERSLEGGKGRPLPPPR